MDGNRFKPDSSFLHNKCATIIHGGVDRISQLPDKIIVDILSFLTLRESARTCVLSSRWLHLWEYTPNLDFTKDTLNFDLDTDIQMSRVERRGNSWDAEKCKYIDLVNSLLQLHKAPSLKQFSTSFYVNNSAQLKVAKWLEFVFLRGVERLELDFRCRDPKYKVVLEELLRGSRLCLHPQTDLISFQSLKRLCLKYFKLSGEAIEMLLRNCPLLEALIIGYATLTSDVEVCGATLMLEHLEVYGCIDQKTIKVSAPNLTSLMVEDRSGKLLLANVPKLVEADFRFRSPSLDEVQHFASAVFCFSSQLKTLNLTIQWPKMFLANGFFPQMPNLNKLVVDYHGVKTQSLLPITALVWASPRLEEFKLVFTDIRAAPIQVVSDAERSPHQHLKLFELAGFINGAVHHIELANYILDNCVALQKIIIRPSPISAATYFQHPLEIADEMQAAIDYAKQQLQGKLPQHIQLQLH